MPKFVGKGETKTIAAEWWAKEDDGTAREWVEIRRFGYGDRQRLVDAALKAGLVAAPGGGDELALSEVTLGALNLEILTLGIKRWTDDQGAIVPVTAEAIRALDEGDAEFILAEINTFNPQKARSAAEQANFRGGD